MGWTQEEVAQRLNRMTGGAADRAKINRQISVGGRGVTDALAIFLRMALREAVVRRRQANADASRTAFGQLPAISIGRHLSEAAAQAQLAEVTSQAENMAGKVLAVDATVWEVFLLPTDKDTDARTRSSSDKP